MGGSMKKSFLLIMLLALCMTACGNSVKGTNSKEQDNRKVLELGVFCSNSEVSRQIKKFNESSKEYRIEIKEYEINNTTYGDGIETIQREILSGKGPDMIDFGNEYNSAVIVGKYTEDLYPYIEKEQEENKEEFFMNVLDSFSYQGGLYALPVGFTLQTLAGSSDSLPDQNAWSTEEMIDWFKQQKEDVILYPGEYKLGVIGFLINGNITNFMNWDTEECSFSSNEFREMVEFANLFPNEIYIPLDYSLRKELWERRVLLYPQIRGDVYVDCAAEYIFNSSDVNYIGYPVKEGSGTFISPGGIALAISIGSMEKEGCWEFISSFLEESYQSSMEYGYPINRNVLEDQLQKAMVPEYTTDEDGNQQLVPKDQIRFEGEEPVNIYSITQEQAEHVLSMIEGASRSATTEYFVLNIIKEETSGYFSGEKTVEEVCDIIQSKMSTYMSEKAQ